MVTRHEEEVPWNENETCLHSYCAFKLSYADYYTTVDGGLSVFAPTHQRQQRNQVHSHTLSYNSSERRSETPFLYDSGFVVNLVPIL